MQRPCVAKRSELAGPLGVTRGDEANAAIGGLLEDPAGVDVDELLAEREGPVTLDVGRLQVAEYLAGTDLADQDCNAEVTGFDGVAEFDAGEPLGLEVAGATHSVAFNVHRVVSSRRPGARGRPVAGLACRADRCR